VSTKSDLHFWVDGRVIQKAWGDDMGIIREVPCVDTDEIQEDLRIGVFRTEGGWMPMTREELPPEFRATLLIMGVNP
jgi:hypothetical protein